MRDGVRVLASALVLGLVALVYVFGPLTPLVPNPDTAPSWVAAMGEAADRPTRFGVDVAFTYGPASPVATGYLNAAWASRTLPLQLGFAALFGSCAALLVAGGRRGRAALAGTGAVALLLVAVRGNPDALFLCLPFPVLLLWLRPDKAARAAAMAGAAALGLTATVKMSYPLAALPLLALGDGAALFRHRRAPLLLPLFAFGVAAGALLYGQRLSDLPAYAAMQGEVVAGYAAAMALDGPDWDLYPFVALALGLVAAAALLWRGPGRWPTASGLAVSLLFLFKAGFIRHDLHSVTAWTGLALLAGLLAWSGPPRGAAPPNDGGFPRRAALGLTAAALFAAFVYVPVMTVRQSVRDGRGAALLRIYAGFAEPPARQASAAWNALRDPAGFLAGLDAAKARAWAAIAGGTPLGPLPGGVDVIPSEPSPVMAAGLDYRPRPSFQEYSTYTPALAEANRAFLRGPSAPRWVLFGPESPGGEMSIDGRFPNLAEGALWPDLLALYRPDHRIGDLVALERRASPAPVAFGPARDALARFGEAVPVEGDGPVWATLDLRPNLAGRALSALYRPPTVRLAATLDDGTVRRFALVPALARAGFLLSPLVDNASDYEALAAGRPAGSARRVRAFAVEATAAGRLFYAPEIAAALRRLDVPASAAPPAAPPEGPVAVPPSGVVSLPLAGLPAAAGRRRVVLGYGLDGGDAPRTCFAARPADGTRATLWSGCLGPGEPPGRVALDVPDGVEELALEARCGGGACSAHWTVEPGAEAASR